MVLAGGLAALVRRSLRTHALSTLVTAGSLALACGLVMATFAIQAQSERAFTGGADGFDAVLGARGSPLQLVLNSVFHLETSPGNLGWAWYERMRDDPRVALAVPYAVGDSFRGFRIVGTVPERFTEVRGPDGGALTLAAGRLFDPGRREAVIGSTVAARAGLKLGSHFHPSHGVTAGGAARRGRDGAAGASHGDAAHDGDDEDHDDHDDHGGAGTQGAQGAQGVAAFAEAAHGADDPRAHDEQYVVVGILDATNSPTDRVVWIPIEGVFRMTGHMLFGQGEIFVAQPGQAIPAEHKEVSAVLIRYTSPMAGFTLGPEINKQGDEATLAAPIGAIMADLFLKIGWMSRVLEIVAYLVVVVAAGSVLASIYNTMNERRREFAILRALGARRGTVFSVIVLEATTIAALGALGGLVVYVLIVGTASAVIRGETGVVLDVWAVHPVLLAAPLGIMVLGALTGLVPAAKAYRTDVAGHLSPPG